MITSCCKRSFRNWMLALWNFKSLWQMLTFQSLHLNQYHKLFPSIPCKNIVILICINVATFIIHWCRFMDSLHSYIAKVKVIITATSSSYVNIPPSSIFLDLVFSFRWLKNELKNMFHDLFTFFKDLVPVSTTSIRLLMFHLFTYLSCLL